MSVAQRLYYESAELEFSAVVSDIRLTSQAKNEAGEKEQLWQIALDRTAFYPEGGGQPWDTGVLVATAPSGTQLEVPVERVEEDEAGEVWHFVRKPLVEGTEITGYINAERRIDHEQQHSGQHLLSAMFLRELKAKTVSFHLGAESVTIDLVLPEGMERLQEEDLQRVEAAANRAIFEGRPLISHWVSREMAEQMLSRGDLKKLPPREAPFRIIQMQGIEFNACGGTHVSNTGMIGSIVLRRIEKVKQGWRVEFCCGMRAVRAAREDFLRLSATAGSLSVGVGDVPGRVAALIEEGKAAGKERKALLDELARAEAVALASVVEPGSTVKAVFSGKDVEFAKRVASRTAALGHASVVGVTAGQEGAMVMARPAASTVHCGNVLREVLSAAGARGGGSAEMAQGVCQADQVGELVEKLAQAFDR